jgi:transposase-like protein
MMQRKVLEKIQAIKLRKQGRSVPEIANELGVAKSSVSTWVRNVELSQSAKRTLLTKITAGQLAGGRRRHEQTLGVEAHHYQTALVQLSSLTINKVHQQLLCALIYWCEGAKNVNNVDFTNADPKLITTFLHLFRATFLLDESKFRVSLHIHSYHDSKKQIAFWSKVTGIPQAQFNKPYQKANTGIQVRENYQGCISVRYHSADTARQLIATAKAAFDTLQ